MAGRTKPGHLHRLDSGDYFGRRVIAFTACIEPRRPVLAEPWVVANLVDKLAQSAEQHGCTVPLYTFMPDHLHLLVIGMDETSEIKAAMDLFKLRSGIWIRIQLPGMRWQESYFDRTVRAGRGWAMHARYIARNPYRAGLITNDEVWPFTGSIGHEVDEVLLDAFWDR